MPVIEGALELLEAGDAVSGGSRRNREWVEPSRSFGADVAESRCERCSATR